MTVATLCFSSLVCSFEKVASTDPGYVESLIVSQFIDSVHDLRRLQKYILKYINYVPKHLIEYIVSPSLIEEILSKTGSDSKSQTIEESLRQLMDSPELYQVNSEGRKTYLHNYKRIMFNHYLFSIKSNR